MTTPARIPLHRTPHCPLHATAPVQEDGQFDPQRFRELLHMGETGATLQDYIHTMRHTTMEPIPLVRQRPSPRLGAGPSAEEYECHPDTWEKMPAEIREHFQLLT